MSYSRRQLYALGETFGESATRKEVGGRIVYGSGGGGGKPAPTTTITESGPTTTTLNRTTLNEIPTYLTDASRDLVTRGQALSGTPFEAYGGPRVAEFSPFMNQAFDRIGGQQVAGQTTEASGLASLAGRRATDFGEFQQGVQQLMNPYMQNVVDIERRKAQEASDQQAAMLSGQAARQGAFGGSGAALQQRALRRDTAQQLSDIQAQGLDRAFQSAAGQFNQGISSGLAASGQLGQLGQAQFGQEMDITQGLGTAGDVQRQREQALLDVGYGDFLAAKKDPFEKLAFQQGLVSGVPYSITQRVSGQEVTQPGKTTSQQFAAPKPAPNAAAQIIGTAASFYGATGGGGRDGGDRGDSLGNIGGPGGRGVNDTASGGMGPSQARAQGGEIKRYAVGGIAGLNQPEMAAATQGMSDPQVANTAAMPGLPGLTAGAEQMRRNEMRMASEGQQASSSINKITTTLSQMSNEELQQYAQMNKGDPYTMALVVAEANRRKEGGMPSQEQPKVVDQQIASMALPEDMGIARLDAGNMDFAGGGIIAFANGGDTERATSPAGDFFRGIPGSAPFFDKKLAELRDRQMAATQGTFERLTPTEKAARAEELRIVEQEIADLQRARTAPVKAAQPAAAPVEPVPEAGLGALVDPAAAPPAEQQNMGAGPAPADDQGIMSLLDQLGETQREGEMAASEIERRGMEARRADLEAAAERAKTSGSDREERLKKREEGMKGDKESNINMSIFEAGLRLMSGRADDGSTDLLSVLASGAQQGLKGYQARLDKINTNKEKLDEDYARLYEIREAKVEASGDRLSQLGLEETALQADAHRRLFNIGAAITGKKIEYKIGERKAAQAFRNAQAASQTPERQAFAGILKKKDGDAVAALTEFNEKFGKQPDLPSYVLKELETIGQERAKLLAGPLPEDMKASQLAQLDSQQQALLNISSRSSGASSIPKAAIDMLRRNPTPEAKRQFDSAFNSPGAADRALAGK